MSDDVSQLEVTSSSVEQPEVAATSVQDGVCRDYLRNVCRRGERCRFLHPVDPTSARRDVIAHQTSRRGIVFCHDFQNAAGCRRGAACRFAHCTRQQEAIYRRTGLLPDSAQRKLALDYALTRALWRGETPVCIDFLKAGGCRRANGQCRYRHVTPAEFEREQLCAMAEMPEAAVRMPGTVYRKRKAPSSVDNDEADDDDEEERCLGSADAASMFTSAKQAVYLAPACNNFRFGCQATVDDLRSVGSDTTHLLGGNNFRLVTAQPPTAVLPVAILPSAPLGVLTTVHSPGLCDVIGVYDRTTPVAPATVAMGTSIICPVAQWL